MKQPKKLTNVNTYLIIALVIVVAVGLYFTLSVPVPKKEAPKIIPPKEIAITILQGCDECSNISSAVEAFKQQKTLNVTKVEEISLEDAKALAKEYNISRLPAIIVKGDIANLSVKSLVQKGDALVFEQAPPPYYDLAENRVKGKVTLTVLSDKTCKDCFDLSKIVSQLKEAQIKIVSETAVDAKSDEGKALVAKYKIEKLPTLVFNKEALEYDVIKQVWDQVGSKESDGSLVLRFVNPPYLNVSTGKTEGLVGLTYLVDKTCDTCYNASVLKGLFEQSFSISFNKEETVDVSSTKGKTLVKKYNIELVPTVVMSKEAGAYPGLVENWAQVGTQEEGAFVFTKVPVLKGYFDQSGGTLVYKNLTSGEVVSGNSTAAAEADITPPSAEK